MNLTAIINHSSNQDLPKEQSLRKYLNVVKQHKVLTRSISVGRLLEESRVRTKRPLPHELLHLLHESRADPV
jgi:hypothetical protein